MFYHFISSTEMQSSIAFVFIWVLKLSASVIQWQHFGFVNNYVFNLQHIINSGIDDKHGDGSYIMKNSLFIL